MLRDDEDEHKLQAAASPLPPSGGDDDWETQEDPSVRAMAALSVDAAAQAMGKMRIMQPPPLPSQDGGAYERVLFDPSNAHALPVSAATASAAAASALDGGRGPMDPVLVACLENPRERLTLLKFEDQIVRFIKSPRESQLVFPPLSSYHRLIIHRLAERCCLEHQTAEYNPYAGGGGYDGNSSRAVTLFRTSQSIVPSVLLIDLSSDRQQQTVTPATAPKIMMRKRGSQIDANGGKNPGDAKNAQRSMQDREKAYAEARARIFGEDTTDSTSVSSSNSSPGASASANASSESSGSAGAKLHNNNQQAAGPDGSRGFGGRGRGGSAAGRGAGGQVNKPQQHQDNADAQDHMATSESAGTIGAPRAQSTKNWKESKVLWRNREQEMNDPDFTRNRDAYRLSRNNNSSANEYSRYPHPQQQMGRYPAPQMDYYNQQQQQQPPLPGRRFPPGGEYNRIDNTGMMRPPPPPDHFRSGGGGFSMNTPPPPPPPAAGGAGRGGYGYNNSPHGRQYQHQHHHSSPSPVRGARNGGGYNDDFPPLGK